VGTLKIWDAHYQGKNPHAENVCGSFWWKDVRMFLRRLDNFRGVAMVQHGRGDMFFFWSYNWDIQASSQPICRRFPRLFSFVIDENSSVAPIPDHVVMEDKYSMVFVRALERIENLSDHAPILLATGTPRPLCKRPFLSSLNFDGYIGRVFMIWLKMFGKDRFRVIHPY
jgi:hypothetical protein